MAYCKLVMSGTAVIVIVVLALLVVVVGSFLIVGLSHRERRTQLQAHQANNEEDPRTDDDQRPNRPGN